MSRTTPTADLVVTPELIKRHGLTSEEFERIKKILGREPNFTELGVFSVMWSEHCSYKNSRKELRKFPTTGPNILVKAGEENAGVVDVGDGWAVANVDNARIFFAGLDQNVWTRGGKFSQFFPRIFI